MNSVTAPSRAPASRTNFATSAVRSVKPAPGVCTVSSDETMVVAATLESGVRDSDLGWDTNYLHVVPAKQGPILRGLSI